MNNIEAYSRLREIKDQFPELTFLNVGYQYLPVEVRERHKEQIAEIEEILKEVFWGIREFNNFHPRKDGTYSIRVQMSYDESFVGVAYLDEAHFTGENKNII